MGRDENFDEIQEELEQELAEAIEGVELSGDLGDLLCKYWGDIYKALKELISGIKGKWLLKRILKAVLNVLDDLVKEYCKNREKEAEA